MAISQIEYVLIRRLREEGLYPDNPSVLELGQSNWYGDVQVEEFYADIERFVSDSAEAQDLITQAKSVIAKKEELWPWHLADIFWKTFLGPHSYEAIDLGGVDERVHKFDLNQPVPLTQQYDIVCNFGTSEHVFNVYQVFKTIHERTKPGGLIFHGMPFQGWIDHGFFNFQPTFMFDLSEANGYGSIALLYAEVNPAHIVALKGRQTIHEMAEKGEVGKNSMIFSALRKPPQEHPFQVPMQAYYSQRLDKESAERWVSLR